jgi:hypothetical protein
VRAESSPESVLCQLKRDRSTHPQYRTIVNSQTTLESCLYVRSAVDIYSSLILCSHESLTEREFAQRDDPSWQISTPKSVSKPSTRSRMRKSGSRSEYGDGFMLIPVHSCTSEFSKTPSTMHSLARWSLRGPKRGTSGWITISR